jgi:hypothetical protein
MIDHARILLQPAISDALPLKRADHSVLKAKGAPDSVADIYNEAGDGYGAYADGDTCNLLRDMRQICDREVTQDTIKTNRNINGGFRFRQPAGEVCDVKADS